MNKTTAFICSLIFAFILTLLILKKLIVVLKKKKYGQTILSDGPIWHKEKEGTPTMGGLSFILTFVVGILVSVFFFYNDVPTKNTLLLLNILLFCVLNALIGLIDDIAKIKKSENKGLSASSKYLLQSVAVIIFLIMLHFFVGIETSINIPFTKIQIELGVFYYILNYFILCGVVNSVNLTDGLDGLASSVMLTVGVFVFIVSFFVFDNPYMNTLAGIIIGSMGAFLIYNYHSAKIFMGDTGSLFLGALVASIGFLVNNTLLVLLFGLVFICEAVSVILQVLFFKISKGKRLFLMAPLHHHFEKKGWNEEKIVTVFSAVNLIACLFAALGIRVL